ncbi:MAG: SDR family NAD(P)-dependent oxidoreductase [Geminicoccaceae bacterium]
MAGARRGRLDGKVALVTGAVRRIGRAIATALAEEGAAVVINTRSSEDEARAVAAEIEAAGGRALVQLADVTDEAAVRAMVEAAIARFGRLDILVNNAADRRHAPLTEISLEEWRHVTGIIIDGAFLCARACLPHMVAAGGGTVVNIGGVSGHLGAHHRAHVVTAKAALVGLTKAIATEYADRGITANSVVPGKIGGARSRTAGESAAMAGGAAPIVGRDGTALDVAAMVRHLCLPASRYITGQTLHVSGGMYMP